MERIDKELNVSNCWGCRGTLMSEEWPWKVTVLNVYQLLLWNQSITTDLDSKELGQDMKSGWHKPLFRAFSLGMGLI
jgi:hypothetical protein